MADVHEMFHVPLADKNVLLSVQILQTSAHQLVINGKHTTSTGGWPLVSNEGAPATRMLCTLRSLL